MSTSNKNKNASHTSYNKKTFTYSPSQADVDAYIKFKSGESKQKPYMKDYKSLHHIEGLSDNSILVYEAIRNLVGMYIVQQKYKESYKNKRLNKLGIGTTRTNNINTSVVGATMIITNPMLQEWIGNKSHNTIKSALEQLESMGFIKCATDGTKKTGRKITLLRDMEEYQPEEIDALEACLKALGKVDSVTNDDVLSEDENDVETTETPVNKPKKKVKKTEKINSVKETNLNQTDSNDVEEDLDDFEF